MMVYVIAIIFPGRYHFGEITQDVPMFEKHGDINKRTSWGAILIGVALALTITLMLGLLGVAIMLSTANPMSENSSMLGFRTGTMIWWLLTGTLGTFIGSYVAASLAGVPRRITGLWHGLTVWAVSTLLTLSFAGNIYEQSMSSAFSVMRPVDTRTQEDSTEQVESSKPPPGIADPAARQLRWAAITPREEAERMKIEVSAAARAAAWSFALLFIGAITGAVGGATGAPRKSVAAKIQTHNAPAPCDHSTEPPPQM